MARLIYTIFPHDVVDFTLETLRANSPVGSGGGRAVSSAKRPPPGLAGAPAGQDGAGAKVIAMAPQVNGGASDADNGNQFRVTCFVPFEYFHRD